MPAFTQNVDDPSICIVRTGKGERIEGELARAPEALKPPNFPFAAALLSFAYGGR